MTVFMHFGKEPITYSFSQDETHPTCGNCAATLFIGDDPFEEDDGVMVYKGWCPNHGSLRVVWEEDEECPEYGGDTGE